ncbi:hypothetical protein QZH41_016540 [Actinostola sp. cb2023]|nr:hypothetical protein QZH41_016540 [Actinostola sp. cb2023]
MEKKNNQRRKSRPVSELITLFDLQEAEERRVEQCQSENSLNPTLKSSITSHKRNSITLSRFGNSEISKSSESVLSTDVTSQKDKNCTVGKAGDKTALTLTLNPKSGIDKAKTSLSSVKPNKKAMDSKKNKSQEVDAVSLPKALQEEPKKEDEPKETVVEDESASNSENCNRRKLPLDDSLAVLRREMHLLRKQDVELMSQLLALNSSIQEFKSNSSSSSMSNFSDTSDAETDITEIEIKPPTRQPWHQRESSGSSDTSDFESRRAGKFRPNTSKQGSVNRDSLGSEVSGYYSNASPRSSPYGSNRSLNGCDVNAPDMFSGSECCSSQPTSPVSGGDPPFLHAQHYRQKTWLNQDFLGMTGSDPSLNYIENGRRLQQPVHSRAFHPRDEKVRRMSVQQKILQTRRNTACSAQSTMSGLSRSGSEQSLSGYDVDSDNSRTSVQAISNRLQKWQRSRSSCALNSFHHSFPSSVQNTITVDLRNNPPLPGTAIELILPLQPLKPTRRSSAVRMAERRPVDKLINTLSKRQSMIW